MNKKIDNVVLMYPSRKSARTIFQKFRQSFFPEFFWKYILNFPPGSLLLLLALLGRFSARGWFISKAQVHFYKIPSVFFHAICLSIRFWIPSVDFSRFLPAFFPRFEHFFRGFFLENLRSSDRFLLKFLRGSFRISLEVLPILLPEFPWVSTRIYPEIFTRVSLRIHHKCCRGISVRVSFGIPLGEVILEFLLKILHGV